MKLFLKILNRFFVFLGVIFFIIIIFLAYFWITDPYNIKPLITGEVNNSLEENGLNSLDSTSSSDTSSPTGSNEDSNPLLDANQEETLRNMGIDPATLPSEITPEMEACFVEKLGGERTQEIVEGSDPSPAEILRAASCL